MDTLTFVAKLVESLAWPFSAIAMVFVLRKEIKDFLPAIKKFKAGPVEVELERVAKELEATKRVAASAEAKAQVVAAKLDETDDPATSEDEERIAPPISSPPATQIERQVLRAMTNSRFATRSITGVSKDTGLNKSVVQVTYGSLIEKGLVVQTTNDEGKLRWYPTAVGRIVASEA